MIERRHRQGDVQSLAVYSDDERFRFRLSRCWGHGASVLFIMLNPSTATEAANDPTIARCESRARRLGFPAYDIANLFAYRATVPGEMKQHPVPVGQGNDEILMHLAGQAELIVCGWGNHGAHLGRGETVEAMLRGQRLALHHLGLTKAGAPRHPLYLGYACAPQAWD